MHTPDLAAGKATTFTYGPEGRLASTTDPDGHTTSLGYEPTGEVRSIVDALGHTAALTHDSLGRVSGGLDPLGRASSSSYAYPTVTGKDAFGTPVSGYTGLDISTRSANGAAVSTDLTGPLADGAMQLGTHAFDDFREPQVSFYRDATIALSYGFNYSGYHDLYHWADRSDVLFASDTPYGAGPYFNETYNRGVNLPHDAIGGIETDYPDGHYEDASFGYDTDRYLTSSTGWWHPTTGVEWDTLGVDAAGRSTVAVGHYISAPDDPNGIIAIPGAAYTYAPGSDQLSVVTDASGTRTFTYDSRGNVQTLAADEGTYTFGYDAVGRNTHILYPDGHTRAQTWDAEGRLLLRCYGGYGGGLPDRCYGASYDAAGNPKTLSDPEGPETLSYDALDRLSSVVRGTATESYTYNALGALQDNASAATGATLVDQRPRLDGSGNASAGVPASVNGQTVTIDPIGRVTSLFGDTIAYDNRSRAFTTTRADGSVETYGYDAWMRRISRTQSNPATYGANEYDVYVGANIGATIDPSRNVTRTWLFEGTDAPLRMTTNAGGQVVYYELDTTGNVRRLRASGGADLGGYRYSAFGVMYPEDGGTPAPTVDQPLRWKGRPFLEVAGGVYDMRARWWSPRLGSFLEADDFAYADANSTLWGWGNQSPAKWGDPSGHCAACVGAIAGGVAGLAYGLYAAPINQGIGTFAGTALADAGIGALAGGLVGGTLGLNPTIDAAAADLLNAGLTSSLGAGGGLLRALGLATSAGSNPVVQKAAEEGEGASCPAAGGLTSRGLTAGDLGLSGRGIGEVSGTVTNQGSARTLSVDMLGAAERGSIPVAELRSALPNLLNNAAADGVSTLSIQASFQNNQLLSQFATQAVMDYDAEISSVDNIQTFVFKLKGQ